MNKISTIIITYNEEDVLEACLKSVLWTDEIIIVDCGSTDKTVSIAKKYTKKVYYHSWEGFSKQKNYAISKTKGNWILSIDADERVSNKLKNEIEEKVKRKNDISAYSIPFKNVFLGRLMRYGGWNPEYHVRLFQKHVAKYNETSLIHESLIIKANIEKLHFSIYHLSHRDISSNLIKTIKYAQLESERLFQENSPKVKELPLLRDIWLHFFNRYIRAKGYKDGMEGFIEAIYQSFSQIFIIQAMLWERQRRRNIKDIYREIDKMIEEGTYEK